MFEIKKPGSYDFILALATIIILVLLSAVSIYGTIESWINSSNDPTWTSGWLYADYLQRMNSYAYPLVVALVVVLCMCIPKRFVPRAFLLQSSLALLAISIIAGIIWGFVAGLGLLLIVSMIVQVAVAIMVVGRAGNLVFEREGIMVQFGSALLHLGFIVFIIDLVLIKEMQNHLNVFWVATALISLGSVLSFYSREISTLFKSRVGRTSTGEDTQS